MDEPVEGEEELMFRGEESDWNLFSFFISLLSGSSRTSQFLQILQRVCVCVDLFFSSSLPVFQRVMEVHHGVADL